MGLFDAFSSKPAEDAAAAQQAGLTAAYSQASGLYGQGRDALTANYTAGLQPFMQNYATAAPGASAYADATGAGGAAGSDRARSSFMTDPGYQFRLQQGNENVLRNAARTTGTAGTGSGNVNVDLQNYGQGQANQGWQQYIANLLPFLGQSNAAATGIGGMFGNLGNQIAGNFTGQGGLAYGTQKGIGDAQANADLARSTADANMWGAVLGGGKLAAGLGGFGGGTPSAPPPTPAGYMSTGGKAGYGYIPGAL